MSLNTSYKAFNILKNSRFLNLNPSHSWLLNEVYKFKYKNTMVYIQIEGNIYASPSIIWQIEVLLKFYIKSFNMTPYTKTSGNRRSLTYI